MPKQKLNIMPKKFDLSESVSFVNVHWSPEKIALEFIKAGLKREVSLISGDIIKGRLGISKDIEKTVLEKCEKEVARLVKTIIETLDIEFKAYMIE